METASAVSDTLLFSIIESPGHPNLTELYPSRNIREVRLGVRIRCMHLLSPSFSRPSMNSSRSTLPTEKNVVVFVIRCFGPVRTFYPFQIDWQLDFKI